MNKSFLVEKERERERGVGSPCSPLHHLSQPSSQNYYHHLDLTLLPCAFNFYSVQGPDRFMTQDRASLRSQNERYSAPWKPTTNGLQRSQEETTQISRPRRKHTTSPCDVGPAQHQPPGHRRKTECDPYPRTAKRSQRCLHLPGAKRATGTMGSQALLRRKRSQRCESHREIHGLHSPGGMEERVQAKAKSE
jgi:hypothetical protein